MSSGAAEVRNWYRMFARRPSTVSPYLFIWAVPGSVLLLPLLAWFLARQRKQRVRDSRL